LQLQLALDRADDLRDFGHGRGFRYEGLEDGLGFLRS
jgi:hypothetical protein